MRLLLGLNVVVALALVATAVGYFYLDWQFDRIPKVEIGPFGEEELEPYDGGPMNVLVVGSDSRADLTAAEEKGFGDAEDVPGQRSDTIMVLRVDPRSTKATLLSIPRDLWVPIAGRTNDQGRPETQRINKAFEYDERTLVNTVRLSLGIPVDHYVEVDFNGFRSIVRAVGGVPVYVPSPVRDKMTGLDIEAAGCVNLDGDQALAYVRSREFETLDPTTGRWHPDPRGDLGRIERQQDFIRRTLRKAFRAGARDPVTLNKLVGAGVDNVEVDAGLSTKDIRRLALAFRSLDPGSVETVALPVEDYTSPGGAVALKLKQPDAKRAIDRFNGRPTPEPLVPDVAPSTVSVRVLNGSGVGGQAAQVAAALRELGFVATPGGNTDAFDHATTTVAYAAGQEEKAQALGARLSGDTVLVEDPSLEGVDLVLTTGGRFAGVAAPPGAAGATTTTATTATTAPPAELTAPPQDRC